MENFTDENEHSSQNVGEGGAGAGYGLRPDGNFKEKIHGVEVTFGPGAKVQSVKLCSDYSSVQVLRLPPGATASTIAEFFEDVLGFTIPKSEITLNEVADEVVATIKFLEGTTAKRVLERFDAIVASGSPDKFQFAIKLIPPKQKFGNWIQCNTARVYWFKSSRKAFLLYKDQHHMKMAKATLERLTTPAGRVPRCKVQRIQRKHLLRNNFTLEVTNLELGIRKEWFTKVFHDQSQRPSKVKLAGPIYLLDEDHCAGLVQALLRSIGPLELFETQDDPKSHMHKATVGFLNAHHAAEAVAKLQDTSHDGFGKLYAELVSEVKFNIPYKIAKVLKARLSKVAERVVPEAKLKVSISSWNDIDKRYVTVRLTGRGPDASKNVSAARSALEHILSGTVILYNDKVLWHPYFARPEALTFLVELSAMTEVYIHRDLTEKQLILYGGQYHQLPIFAATLSSKYLEVMKAENNELGTPSDTVPEEKFGSGQCVVCATAEPKSFKTTCGHTYCIACFENQVAAADNNVLPLRCVGAGGTELSYHRPFTMKELVDLLPFKKFQRLLATSLRTYIDTHKNANTKELEYTYCPTPGCCAVYRATVTPSDNGDILFCSKCLSSICTTCWTPIHPDITCETNKRNIAESTEAIAFAKFKAENEVKDCPKCDTSIQKSDGCNHMICTGCNAHICWACMEVFETANGLDGCYAHLTAVHGGFGVVIPPEGQDEE